MDKDLLTRESPLMAVTRRLRELWDRRRSPAGELAELPDGFDWREYLARYPDLSASGVDSEAKAAGHWRRHGAAEGRWGGAASYPTRDTLACPSVHSLYLRATGTLVCWDDAGNDTVLQAFDRSVHYGRDVYLGPVFDRIRRALWEGRMPFPEVCQQCLVLRSRTPHSSYHRDRAVVEIFQVEPSFRCTLDCPGCVPLAVRKQAPPQNLPLGVLEKIVADFRESGITVKAFDFQGHGEPLLHPGLWDQTRLVKAAYPESFVTVTTNAHGKVGDDALDSGIDEVVCAIDGVDQESFAPYRVHGRFDLAYRFMSDFGRLSKERGRPVHTVWKYVLFEHNADPEQLVRAQHLAHEGRIDEIVFVFTRNGPRATRVERPEDVPRVGYEDLKISFRYHEPVLDDLRHRLADARAALATGEPEERARAAELAGSVEHNLERFFPAGVPEGDPHRELVDGIAELRATDGFEPAAARRLRLSVGS